AARRSSRKQRRRSTGTGRVQRVAAWFELTGMTGGSRSGKDLRVVGESNVGRAILPANSLSSEFSRLKAAAATIGRPAVHSDHANVQIEPPVGTFVAA